MTESSRASALAVNSPEPYFSLGQAVRIVAPSPDDEGRSSASPRALQHHGRIGIVVYAERCEREMTPRILYSVAIAPAIQVRLYACELERFDGEMIRRTVRP